MVNACERNKNNNGETETVVCTGASGVHLLHQKDVLFFHLFFDSCVHIGEVALTHHTECPHLFP